ncbi:hypothetical protein Hanom_Chr12g01174121 [Helianthus anomalus]
MGTLGRAAYTVGFWIRETGQAMDRLGSRLQGNNFFKQQRIQIPTSHFITPSFHFLDSGFSFLPIIRFNIQFKKAEILIAHMLKNCAFLCISFDSVNIVS